MVLVAIEVLPVESKPPAAVGERISKDERHDLGATTPLPTRASSFEQGRAGDPVNVTTEAGRTFQVGIDPVHRKAIPMHRLNCFSGILRALASLGV